MNTVPLRDPGAAKVRKTIAERRLGANSRCSKCGETRAMALVAGSRPLICASCKRTAVGKSIVDKHHVAGKNNSSIVIPICVNDHQADLSELQRDWSKKTLENPHRSPFLIAAACIRGFVDTVIHLIKKLLLWIADMLEKADLYMVEKFGDKWWVDTPINQFDRNVIFAETK